MENPGLKPFCLIDLNAIDDETIKKQVWSGVMELTLKHIFKRDIAPYLPDIIQLLKEIKEQKVGSFTESVLLYIMDRGNLEEKATLVNLVKAELSDELGEKMSTFREHCMEEGRQEGMQQGMQQGRQEGESTAKKHMAINMLKEGYDIVMIAKITELSEEDVAELFKTVAH